MIDFSAVLNVSVLAVGVALTPGPNMIHLASRSISQGRAAGLAALGGVAAGFAIYLLATVYGLSTLFAAVPLTFIVVKWAGAGYLLWLAFQMIRSGGVDPFNPVPVATQSHGRLFTMGLATNLLNPKIALMYASLLPLLVDPGRGPAWAQLLQLGAVQIVLAVSINAAVVFTAGALSRLLRARPRLLTAQRYGSAGLLTFFAVKLATAKAT